MSSLSSLLSSIPVPRDMSLQEPSVSSTFTAAMTTGRAYEYVASGATTDGVPKEVINLTGPGLVLALACQPIGSAFTGSIKLIVDGVTTMDFVVPSNISVMPLIGGVFSTTTGGNVQLVDSSPLKFNVSLRVELTTTGNLSNPCGFGYRAIPI